MEIRIFEPVIEAGHHTVQNARQVLDFTGTYLGKTRHMTPGINLSTKRMGRSVGCQRNEMLAREHDSSLHFQLFLQGHTENTASRFTVVPPGMLQPDRDLGG